MAVLRRYQTVVSDSARWEGFTLRDGDIVVSPPPKCGTTWAQMLCALLVFGRADFHRPLTEISPWFDSTVAERDLVVARYEAQGHRRVIKSHTPLDGLPFDDRVTYVCVGRDPRDVALSFDNHMANLRPEVLMVLGASLPPPLETPRERFRAWVTSDFGNGPEASPGTLANTVHHLQTFWDRRHQPGVVLFHYDDLLADLPGQLRRLRDALGADRTDDEVDRLAEEAYFERMRRRADDLAPEVDHDLWKDNQRFFHKGSSGQWREALGAEDLRVYHQRIDGLASPDLADWLHRDREPAASVQEP